MILMGKSWIPFLNKNVEELETVPSSNGGGTRRRKKAAKNIDHSLTLPMKDKILNIKNTMKIIQESMNQEEKKQAEKVATPC